jgi:uncharacterized protein
LTDPVGEILGQTRTIAVLGLSGNPARPSYDVARYLQQFYEIYPVNPNEDEILGVRCYPDLASVPVAIDLVDVFQRSENVPGFVPGAIAAGVQVFWMQLGISNAAARARLEQAGIAVVENLCLKVEHARRRL